MTEKKSEERLKHKEVVNPGFFSVGRGWNELSIAKFGPNFLGNIMDAMRDRKFNGETYRPATTAESIRILNYDYRAKNPEIARIGKNPQLIASGTVFFGENGVYINPTENPYSFGGVADELFMKRLEKVMALAFRCDDIFLGENDFSFVPYETFKNGEQSAAEFSRSGLARGLEHSRGYFANNLDFMTSGFKRINVSFDKEDLTHYHRSSICISPEGLCLDSSINLGSDEVFMYGILTGR